MNTAPSDAALPLGPAGGFKGPRAWRLVTGLIVAGFFVEAGFAGAMLSGMDWARAAHRATALALIASSVSAGLAALITQRRTSHGTRLGLMLLGLAATAVVQAAVGAMSAKGANLVWVHVPLGVALVEFAGRTVASAGRLGQ